MFLFGSLAQLVRVPASHAGGRAFEPRSFHQKILTLGSEDFFVWVSGDDPYTVFWGGFIVLLHKALLICQEGTTAYFALTLIFSV